MPRHACHSSAFHFIVERDVHFKAMWREYASSWGQTILVAVCSFLSFFSGRKHIRLARQFPHNQLASNHRPVGLAMVHDFSNRISVSPPQSRKQTETEYLGRTLLKRLGPAAQNDRSSSGSCSYNKVNHIRKGRYTTPFLFSHLYRDPTDCIL